MSRANDTSVMGRLVRAVSTLGGLTMVSRVFGLVREMAITSILGPGAVTDAFNLALRLPSMFRQMFAEGAFSASFVPLFAEKTKNDGEEGARHFASAVFSILLLIIGLATVVAIIFMPQIITLMGPKPEIYDLAVNFTRITSVYLLCMVLSSLVIGVLNNKRHFAAGAIAPIFFNIFIIGGLVASVAIFGLTDEIGGFAMAVGVAVAGLLQVLFVWLVCALRFKFVIYVPAPKLTKDIRHLFTLMVPGLIAAGGLQLNTWVGTIIALRDNAGSLTYLSNAERLYQLPVGLIAVAFGVAALPQLAQFFAEGQRDKAVQTINLGVELALLIAMPAALALTAMPEVVVKLLFERGRFDAQDTIVVSSLLATFTLALPALALQRVFNASFHARKHMRPPMIMTLSGVALNILLAITLTPQMGLLAIPTAIVISAWAQVVVSAIWVRIEGLWQPSLGALWRYGAIVASGIIMAIFLVLAKTPLLAWSVDSTLLLILATGALVVGGMVLYFASAFVLRGVAPELRSMLKR